MVSSSIANCRTPPISVRGDADALSQIIVNLLSNAEKYSNGEKEITLQLAQKQSPLPHAEVKVLDRGSGVPRGSEEKIFEKFYRAHDSLEQRHPGFRPRPDDRPPNRPRPRRRRGLRAARGRRQLFHLAPADFNTETRMNMTRFRINRIP